MNSLGMDYAYNQRDPARRAKGIAIVVAVHLVIGYVLVSGMARSGLNILKKPLEAVVVEAVIPPPPPPPPPPKPIEKAPEAPKVDAPPPPFVPPPDVTPPATSTAPAIVSTAAPPPTPPAPVTPPPPKEPDAKAVAAAMETEYQIKVKAMLEAAKRYPTGRKASQERPQGQVRVWFILARSGALVDSGVLVSSDSNLLDDAALATVRRSTYPAWPTNTWVGQEQHKFEIVLAFSPPSS